MKESKFLIIIYFVLNNILINYHIAFFFFFCKELLHFEFCMEKYFITKNKSILSGKM